MMRTLIGIVLISLGFFVLAGLLRLITRKHGTAVGSVSVALDVFVLYLLVILLPLYIPGIVRFLPSLPFTSIDSGTAVFMSVSELSRDHLSLQLINLILISFLFGLADALLPDGKNILTWFLLRAAVMLSICAVIWCLNRLGDSFIPGYIQTYAPMVLLLFIALLLALTVFKWLFGLILGISCGPVTGAVYTFVVGNIVGKQLAKSAFTCVILVSLLILAEQLRILTVNLSDFPLLIHILALLPPAVTKYLIARLF